MRALVTGANGFIGSTLTRRLVEAGHEVKAMCRKTSDRSLLEGIDCALAFADLTDPDSLPPALDGVEIVYHCAAALGAPSQAAFDRVNKQGSADLVGAVLADGHAVERFVLVSSIAAGGPGEPGRPREESERAAPISQYGRSKRASEEALAPFDGRVPYTIVRPPIVYGPASHSMVPLFRGVQRGFLLAIGGPPRRASFVHVRDLVEGIILAGAEPVAVGEIYNLIGPEDGTLADFQRAIAAALAVEPFELRIPPPVLRFAGAAADKLKGVFGIDHSFGSDTVLEGLAESWVVSGEKAERELGFEPKIRFEEGVRDAIEDFRARGWLD